MPSRSRCAPSVNTPLLPLRLYTSHMPHARAALALSLFLLLCDRRWLARWERRCPSSCAVGAVWPGGSGAGFAVVGSDTGFADGERYPSLTLFCAGTHFAVLSVTARTACRSYRLEQVSPEDGSRSPCRVLQRLNASRICLPSAL